MGFSSRFEEGKVMKERNRFFALLLAVMMVFTYMPSMAFAEAGDEGEEAAVTEVQEDAVTEEAVQEEPAEADKQAEEPEAQAEEDEVVVDAAPADEEAGLPKSAPGKFEPAAPAKMTPEAEIIKKALDESNTWVPKPEERDIRYMQDAVKDGTDAVLIYKV